MAAKDRLLPLKLTMPRPSRPPVRRPRLVQLLSGALDARLTVVSAPPGFGKTTALVDWLSALSIGHAWLSLDEADNDPVRFVRYLSAAVGELAPTETGSVEEVAPGGDPVQAISGLAVLLAERGEPSILVLDDYHLITAPEVQRAVGVLLEGLPPQAHLVLSTRADPALPLARMRARNDLVEVRADALRFTLDEARRFFTERMEVALGDPDLETLVGRTEGWPAVLQLAALSLAGRSDIPSRVRAFAATHRFVLDYVIEEVLAALPPETQDFLLRTSILEKLSGALCDAVSGSSGGQARLEALERANLLLVPLDDERVWYRYHALFAEVLKARLAVLHPEDVAALHARASTWCEEHGDDEAAIAHAIQSGDLERTSEIVAEASIRHIHAGELSTVRRWLDALPVEVVRDHAQLCTSYAWCVSLATESEETLGWMLAAERALESGRGGGLLGPAVPAQLALLRSRLAQLAGDSATAIVQARRARELVPDGLPAYMEATLRGDATEFLGVGLLVAGDLEGAAAAYEESLPDLRRAGNVFAAGRAIASTASILLARGDARGALRVCEGELERSGPASAESSPAIWAALGRARVELGQLEAAETAARHALELATRAGDETIAQSARATLARLAPLLAAGAGRRARSTSGPGSLVEALSERELEVLQLVALGRSNSQIAAKLFVTVGTVKSHLHTISGKLGVANRVEAVARGRELGLLP
ncbi:MAG TPA: LuxR C-terminal-related transcriptional regulator [Candidatus Binatia bacterium]|nr:LuxR C-terminal-related transcriptional regulator [Candidatus Binatia bacterium]